MLKNASWAILVMAFFSGCGVFKPTEKQCYKHYPPNVINIDSTFVIDSTIVRPRVDTSFTFTLPEENRDTLIIVRKGPLESNITKRGNEVEVSISQDPDTIEVAVPNWEAIEEAIDSTNRANQYYWNSFYKSEFKEKSRKLRASRNQWRLGFFVALAALIGVIWIAVKK